MEPTSNFRFLIPTTATLTANRTPTDQGGETKLSHPIHAEKNRQSKEGGEITHFQLPPTKNLRPISASEIGFGSGGSERGGELLDWISLLGEEDKGGARTT